MRNKRDRDFTECSLGSEGEVGKERRIEGKESEVLYRKTNIGGNHQSVRIRRRHARHTCMGS